LNNVHHLIGYYLPFDKVIIKYYLPFDKVIEITLIIKLFDNIIFYYYPYVNEINLVYIKLIRVNLCKLIFICSPNKNERE